MNELKKYDVVTFDDNDNINHGYIEAIEKNQATVHYYHLDTHYADNITLPLNKLAYVDPIILKTDQIKMFCRYELRWTDIKRGFHDYTPVFFENIYSLTIDDLKTALQNIRTSEDSNMTIFDDWYYPLQDYLFNYIDAFDVEEGLKRFITDKFEKYDDIYDMLMSGTPFQNEIDQILEWLDTCSGDDII